jgi:hypothetical protein
MRICNESFTLRKKNDDVKRNGDFWTNGSPKEPLVVRLPSCRILEVWDFGRIGEWTPLKTVFALRPTKREASHVQFGYQELKLCSENRIFLGKDPLIKAKITGSYRQSKNKTGMTTTVT